VVFFQPSHMTSTFTSLSRTIKLVGGLYLIPFILFVFLAFTASATIKINGTPIMSTATADASGTGPVLTVTSTWPDPLEYPNLLALTVILQTVVTAGAV